MQLIGCTISCYPHISLTILIQNQQNLFCYFWNTLYTFRNILGLIVTFCMHHEDSIVVISSICNCLKSRKLSWLMRFWFTSWGYYLSIGSLSMLLLDGACCRVVGLCCYHSYHSYRFCPCRIPGIRFTNDFASRLIEIMVQCYDHVTKLLVIRLLQIFFSSLNHPVVNCDSFWLYIIWVHVKSNF